MKKSKTNLIIKIALVIFMTIGQPFLVVGHFCMIEIKLDKGLVALIDDEDFERISQYHYYADKIGHTYYAKRRIWLGDGKSTSRYLHRDIANPPKNTQVDHKDRNGLNNQKNNLRICSRSQNMTNQRIQINNTSGYLGVTFRKDRKKWKAQICKNYKLYNCGLFDTPEEAAIAFNKKAIELHGEFASLNHI